VLTRSDFSMSFSSPGLVKERLLRTARRVQTPLGRWHVQRSVPNQSDTYAADLGSASAGCKAKYKLNFSDAEALLLRAMWKPSANYSIATVPDVSAKAAAAVKTFAWASTVSALAQAKDVCSVTKSV